MDDDDEPENYYELIQWRSLGCLISAVIALGLAIRLFNHFFAHLG
ncbi:MAG TPA: hypothetical protein VHC22_20280 [Pirellulales bacterium]|nr:hypothetical protein [Pirellulales bacterium]